MIEAFDSALAALRREKFRLEADLKAAELKLLVYFQVIYGTFGEDNRRMLIFK
jgi:hypothetical protein